MQNLQELRLHHIKVREGPKRKVYSGKVIGRAKSLRPYLAWMIQRLGVGEPSYQDNDINISCSSAFFNQFFLLFKIK